jgi:hypothetical protein
VNENVRFPCDFQNWLEAEKLVVFASFVIHLTEQDMFTTMQLSGNKYLELKLKGSE